ncbi:hypothetical protein ACFY3V_33095 [Streptosporangium sp. NPDC000095]|uniref:hypothetical protein n=1 Tax=Streptosporangium sp. NPDC000095 TaxID=3366184 RepID=UPI003681D191
MSSDFGTPHAVCDHCGYDLERKSALDGIVYLNWRLDPKLDRVACTASPSKRHAPRHKTSVSTRRRDSKLP